ncbi:unnamed protein product [Closterium sp. Yama58-4]|nr:unnamed protein product [Closterium sp. Yama58-4]
MAAERAVEPLIDLVKHAVLAAVREELAAHKEEVDELRHMLAAVNGELEEVKGELAVVKGGLAVVKGELAAVKREMADHEDATAEKLAESSRASGVWGLIGNGRKRRQETTAKCFWEEERRRDAQELHWPRVMEELAACKEWRRIHDLKLNLELEIGQSEGDQKNAWLAIQSASQKPNLDLKNLHLSDAMLAHVSTMTHLKSIDLHTATGFSAEGMKHLYKLPQLEKLLCNRTDVSDSSLEGIVSLTSLAHLNLWGTKVTDAGLAHLTGLPSLKVLVLAGCKGVTSAGMVDVVRLTGLETLALIDTAVTDDGLHQLTALTNLTTLLPPEGGYLTYNSVRRRIGR